jgi:GT2 family glycosyltransferase
MICFGLGPAMNASGKEFGLVRRQVGQTAMAIPCISVLIVNYNTSTLLEQCLRSIFDSKGDFAMEVLVADNGSTDGAPEMVRANYPEVSLIRYWRNVGYTRAINPLLRQAKGQYCLILHPDLELLPDTLRDLVDFLESHPQAGIVGGDLYYPDGTPNPCEILFPGFRNDLLGFAMRVLSKMPGGRKLIGNYNPTEWSHRSTSRVNWVWNACMMIRREVLERVGHFDEDFYVWYGDWDLCKRATDAGWWVYYVRGATAIHHERQSFGIQSSTQKEVLYKVDGWHSAPRQIQDRHRFLKKHASRLSIMGVKVLNIVENALRLSLILASALFRRVTLKEALFPIGMCIQTIQAILKA